MSADDQIDDLTKEMVDSLVKPTAGEVGQIIKDAIKPLQDEITELKKRLRKTEGAVSHRISGNPSQQ